MSRMCDDCGIPRWADMDLWARGRASAQVARDVVREKKGADPVNDNELILRCYEALLLIRMAVAIGAPHMAISVMR